LALCEELACHVTGNQALLENQQFELVFRLINAALQVGYNCCSVMRLAFPSKYRDN
jgi:hypothetical protein